MKTVVLFLMLMYTNYTYACRICINELNTDTSEIPELHEFLELSKCGCKSLEQPSKDNHLLLVIKEYDKQQDGAVIVLYINLQQMNTLWPENNNYFLIGNDNLAVLPDLSLSHSDVGFRKKRKRTRVQMYFNLEATPQKFRFVDILENGNKAVMAVVLLQQMWRTADNSNNLFSRFKSLTRISSD